MSAIKQTSSNNPPGNPNLKPGPGRPKGSQNKSTVIIKDIILGALQHLEDNGKGLQVLAEKRPEWFYEHFIKQLIPKGIDFNPADGKGLNWNITIRDTAVDDNEDFLL